MTTLEDPSQDRLCILPLRHRDIYEGVEQQRKCFWVPSEIYHDLEKDRRDWAQLSPGVQHFLGTVLAFFAISDGLVNNNLSQELMRRVRQPEALAVWRYQSMMEDIHNEVYGQLIESYIPGLAERQLMFDAVANYPTIRRKTEWIQRWMGMSDTHRHDDPAFIEGVARLMFNYDSGVATAQRLRPGIVIPEPAAITGVRNVLRQRREPTPLNVVILINTIVEGLFFSSSFASIFWVFHQYSKLRGLSKANEFISRDEAQHTAHGVRMYRVAGSPLPESKVHEIMREAVAIETEFVGAALPADLPGMNAGLMTEYVQWVADDLLRKLGYEPLWKVDRLPLSFMNKQSVGVRMSDFFVTGVSEYSMGDSSGGGVDPTVDPTVSRHPLTATRDESDI
jgi:ribonucleotide reductase beta subunit family protein with ferritin-like domain